MSARRTIADPAIHYGSPKGATRGFLVQRLTGAFNILFLGFLAWLVVRLAGADAPQMLETVRQPWVALGLAALLVSVAVHMRLGMREIIEDYVHDPRLNRLSLGVNDVFVILVAAGGLAAVAKIAFWG